MRIVKAKIKELTETEPRLLCCTTRIEWQKDRIKEGLVELDLDSCNLITSYLTCSFCHTDIDMIGRFEVKVVDSKQPQYQSGYTFFDYFDLDEGTECPTLRLEPTPTKRPIITLRINGHEYRFLIDTGATHTVLHPSLLPDLNTTQVASRRQIDCHTVGNKVSIDFIAVVFRFAGVSIPQTMFNQYAGENIDHTHGLIGQDILQQFKSVTFDNVRRVVKFEL